MKRGRTLEMTILSLSFYWWEVRDPDRRQDESDLTSQAQEDPRSWLISTAVLLECYSWKEYESLSHPSHSSKFGRKTADRDWLVQSSWLSCNTFYFQTSSILTRARYRVQKDHLENHEDEIVWYSNFYMCELL